MRRDGAVGKGGRGETSERGSESVGRWVLRVVNSYRCERGRCYWPTVDKVVTRACHSGDTPLRTAGRQSPKLQRSRPTGPSELGPPVARRTLMISFFFQAEDGIRDVAVTGVQTCALPI